MLTALIVYGPKLNVYSTDRLVCGLPAVLGFETDGDKIGGSILLLCNKTISLRTCQNLCGVLKF